MACAVPPLLFVNMSSATLESVANNNVNPSSGCNRFSSDPQRVQLSHIRRVAILQSQISLLSRISPASVLTIPTAVLFSFHDASVQNHVPGVSSSVSSSHFLSRSAGMRSGRIDSNRAAD
ncbi:hypothetical protein MTP99_015905 [Tenebrio molitor]|nr:hypothetical protein MTP99_015905 [Tenebrio molitor]